MKTPQVSFSPVRLFDQELTDVSIGSLRTDENGNLIVLGGNGKSDHIKTYKGTKLPIRLITITLTMIGGLMILQMEPLMR